MQVWVVWSVLCRGVTVPMCLIWFAAMSGGMELTPAFVRGRHSAFWRYPDVGHVMGDVWNTIPLGPGADPSILQGGHEKKNNNKKSITISVEWVSVSRLLFRTSKTDKFYKILRRLLPSHISYTDIEAARKYKLGKTYSKFVLPTIFVFAPCINDNQTLYPTNAQYIICR